MARKFIRTKALVSSIVFFSISLCVIFGLVFGIKYIGTARDNTKMPINKVSTDEKKISLSIDVAWGTNNIDEILDVLDKHDVKATFFLVGSWVDNNKELVKEIYDRGHDIANHSNTHASMVELPEEAIVEEIETTAQKIEEITGEKTTLYRPPFGEIDETTLSICESLGYKVIKWDVDSMDWKENGPSYVVDRVIKNIEPGSIVLFHANAKDISTYLDTIITNLKKENYDIITVSELVYNENYSIDSNGVQKLIE